MKLLEVQKLNVSYGRAGCDAIHDLTFSVGNGQWLMIVGPNGAGKSTVVNAISRGLPYSGRVLFEGRDIQKLKPALLARNVGVLSQSHFVGYAFTVGEIVRLGRYAYAPTVFSQRGEGDEAQVQRALELTGMTEFEQRSVLTLSGGELQRCFLAQLFAQNPRLLILDEPTNHLDLVYQKQIFELIGLWLKDDGTRAVISVVHDLSLSKAHGSHALLLDKGRAMAFGPADEVFTPKLLNAAYSMDVYAWMRTQLEQWQQ